MCKNRNRSALERVLLSNDSLFVIQVYEDGHSGVLGIWGEWLFIFREGSTGNYFQGFGEQAHSLENLGSPVKKL